MCSLFKILFQMSRTQVVKTIWSIVKERKLEVFTKRLYYDKVSTVREFFSVKGLLGNFVSYWRNSMLFKPLERQRTLSSDVLFFKKTCNECLSDRSFHSLRTADENIVVNPSKFNSCLQRPKLLAIEIFSVPNC